MVPNRMPVVSSSASNSVTSSRFVRIELYASTKSCAVSTRSDSVDWRRRPRPFLRRRRRSSGRRPDTIVVERVRVRGDQRGRSPTACRRIRSRRLRARLSSLKSRPAARPSTRSSLPAPILSTVIEQPIAVAVEDGAGRDAGVEVLICWPPRPSALWSAGLRKRARSVDRLPRDAVDDQFFHVGVEPQIGGRRRRRPSLPP